MRKRGVIAMSNDFEDVIWAASLRFSEVEHGDWIVHGVNMNRSPKIAICARKGDAEYIAKTLNLVRNLRAEINAYQQEDDNL